MPVIALGQYIPDAADLGNPGSVDIRNALPGTNSYKPMPQFSALTDALDARARGAIDVRDKDLNVYQYAGDASKLYELSGTTWADVSLITVTAAAVVSGGTGYSVSDTLTVVGGTGTAATLTVDSVSGGVITGVSVASEGSYSSAPSNPVSVSGGGGSGATFNLTTANYSTSSEEIWEFVRWKNNVLAVNWDDYPQTIVMGAGAFANLTTAFKARHIAVVGNHVVVANTNDSTDGNVPDRVRWSAFDDETDWAVDPSTGADYSDLKGSPVQRVFGGEYGVILTRDSTYRMLFVGAPVWFQIDEVLPGIGTLAPGACSRIGDVIYTWSNQGFIAISGATGVQYIGAGKVDNTALEDLDDAYLHRITCVADPRGGRVFWSYPGAGNTSGQPNRILCYDRNFDKWSVIDQEVDMLWRAGGVGFTLEQLDSFSSSIDELDVSLDSSQWKGGGGVILAAFDSAHEHGFFDGDPMTATVDTREMELNPGHKTFLTSFRPLVDGGTVTAQVGTRNRQTDAVTFGSVLSQTSAGRFSCRSNSRFHRVRLSLSGVWEDAIGIEIDQYGARRAGRRG